MHWSIHNGILDNFLYVFLKRECYCSRIQFFSTSCVGYCHETVICMCLSISILWRFFFAHLMQWKALRFANRLLSLYLGSLHFLFFCWGICFWHQMKVKSNDIGHKKTIESCIVVVHSFSTCWFVLKISFSFESAREKISQFKKKKISQFIKSFFVV